MVKLPGFNSADVIAMVKTYVTGVTVDSEEESELTLVLPQGSSGQFQMLFTEIKERQESMKIASYGIAVTTMEEVFIRCGQVQWTFGFGHLTSHLSNTGTLAQSQMMFFSAKNMTSSPGNTTTFPLRSLLLTHLDEVPLCIDEKYNTNKYYNEVSIALDVSSV